MRAIPRWQRQYLGASMLPPRMSQVELEAFFTFSAEERILIRSRCKATLRIAAALQLGFLRMTGRSLEVVRVIPSTLLKYVGDQLDVAAPTIASLRAIYRRRMTRFQHQKWAMDMLGFSRPTDRQLRRLLPYLRAEAQHAASIEALVQLAKVWLYQHRFLYPGDRPVRDTARHALAASEEGVVRLIRDAIPEATLAQWEDAVLACRAETTTTYLEWLQAPPRRRSTQALREQIERIDFLKALGVHHYTLSHIPLDTLRQYARALRVKRPAHLRTLREPTRVLRLVCFLRFTLMQTTDTALLLASRQIGKIVREAYERARLLEAEQSLSYRAMTQRIFVALEDASLSDEQFREQVRGLKHAQTRPPFSSRAAATRWILSESGTPIRALLVALRKLTLQSDGSTGIGQALAQLTRLYATHSTQLPAELSPMVSPKPWQAILDGEDRGRALRALEAATLMEVRKGLRNGAVWIDSSAAFRNRDDLLISPTKWAQVKARRCAQLNLPLTADRYLDRLTVSLEDKLKAVDAAIVAGEIAIVDDTIRIPRLTAITPPADIERMRDALFQDIGVVQFPDLLLQMDSQIGFSRAMLGRAAASDAEVLKVYGGMLAHGTSLDATAVALMVPQLSPSQILSGMQLFEDGPAVRAANETVTSFQRQLPVAAVWGDGSLVSSDMMSLDVSRQIWSARLDPKRKVASVGTYTHVSDFWSVVYDQPIVLNERQAGAAIEGAIRQEDIQIERLAVDTHGYTDFAMGQAKLLGFDLCPRLKRLAERTLHVPQGIAIPRSLSQVVEADVGLRPIKQHWDQLLRIAASIETGHTTATIALARFGSAAAGDPIYRAGVSLGRLVRSLYLCDYFTSEPFRRTINRILVHGEAVHQLQRAIYLGAFSKPRGQRPDELIALSGSLTLMTNLCLAWTASRIQEVLSARGTGDPTGLQWLPSISSAHFRNINLRGTFNFPLDQYRDRLLDGGRLAANT